MEVKLIHQQKQFPLIISEKLEKKIRVLCNKFPSTEWSGQLFYTYTGSFKEGNIKFVAEDLLFMDTGDSTTTEFYLDEGNAACYIADHKLWNCQIGLIHSHHNMKAFFSGQDSEMLKQEGLARNHFLSLVVNNKGEYVARITIKETYKHTIQTVLEYHTYNNDSVSVNIPEKEEASQIISTYDLNITNDFQFTCDDYDELMEIIAECDERKKERKEKEKAEQPQNKLTIHDLNEEFPFSTFKSLSKEEPKFPTVEEEDVPVFAALTNKQVLQYTYQMVTLNFICPDYITLDKSTIAYTEKKLAQRFKDKFEYTNAMHTLVDYLIDNEIIGYLETFGPTEEDTLTFALVQILEKLETLIKENPNNVYLEELYNYLNCY